MRPIKHRTEWGDRPERTEGGGLRHYDEKEAIRYSSTPQTIVIQTELASRALSLLQLQLPKGHLLLNIGCGSGLCGAVLTRHHHAWVGTDISLPMLHLAQRNPACSGRVVASDMTQGLPFCPGIFDAAVSISAVQWICVGPRPRIAAALFFRDLYRCLKHGAKAVLQVYIEHDEQTTLLLDAAHQAGFDEVGYYVDFPHPTAAKKFFICAIKGGSFCRNSHLRSETRASNTLVHTASLYEEWGHDRKCCPLAWPARGSCLLRWISHSTSSAWSLSSQEQACSRCSIDALQTSNTAINGVVERLQREHSLLGRRALRLLRHATGGGPLPLGLMQSTHSSLHNNTSSENNNSSNDMGERGGEDNNRRDCNCDDSALRIEGSAVASNGLMHCGGCTTVHMRLAADWISSSSAHAHAPGVFSSSSGKVEPIDFSSLLIEMLLRLCSEESMVRVWDCSTSLFTPLPNIRQKNRDHDDDGDGVAAADGDQSAGGTAKPPVDNTWTAWITSAAIDDSATSQLRFFWLESLPGRADAAILHANKLPPFFVLCRDYSPRSLKAAGQGRQRQNQPERLETIKDLFQNTLHKDFVGIQSWCNALGGCCVGMDVTVVDGEGSLACAWVLYVHGLQETRREEVARWMNDYTAQDGS